MKQVFNLFFSFSILLLLGYSCKLPVAVSNAEVIVFNNPEIGEYQIKGKIVKIFDDQEDIAQVQIVEVLKKGRNTTESLMTDSVIQLHFVYSLHKTDSVSHPDLMFSLPGLKTNDYFIGNIKPKLKLNSSKPDWLIYNYSKVPKK